VIKPSITLQELRRRIYRKAKAEKQWRFWGLYVHVTKRETLTAAYQEAKANDGSPGIDEASFQSIEERGVEKFLAEIRGELLAGRYKPSKNRRVEIPKGNGKTRRLGIPTIKDRVVQGALKLILEPIFEADFHQSSYAYRPKRTAHQALDRVVHGLIQGLTQVIDVDLKSYFRQHPASSCTSQAGWESQRPSDSPSDQADTEGQRKARGTPRGSALTVTG